ncbi:MAG: hypothetical protein J6B91_02045 [Prevotella sp.]|nr:hypothetical protein [Prevotella sp.]
MKIKKKSFAVLVLLFVFIPVFSQLNVYSNGNAGIARGNGATSAHLMIGNEGTVYPN